MKFYQTQLFWSIVSFFAFFLIMTLLDFAFSAQIDYFQNLISSIVLVAVGLGIKAASAKSS